MHLLNFLLFLRETTFVTSTFVCFPVHQIPSKKGLHSYSKRKEFTPKGSKFFPCRVNQFSEGHKDNINSMHAG